MIFQERTVREGTWSSILKKSIFLVIWFHTDHRPKNINSKINITASTACPITTGEGSLYSKRFLSPLVSLRLPHVTRYLFILSNHGRRNNALALPRPAPPHHYPSLLSLSLSKHTVREEPSLQDVGYLRNLCRAFVDSEQRRTDYRVRGLYLLFTPA